MKVDGRELHEMVVEQRLLRDVVRLTRRCDGPAPRALLDAVLAGLPAGGTDDVTVLALGRSG